MSLMIKLRFSSYGLFGLYIPSISEHLWYRYALVLFMDETLRIRRTCVATTAKLRTKTMRFDTEDEDIVFYAEKCFIADLAFNN